jgi:hypothetical protein
MTKHKKLMKSTKVIKHTYIISIKINYKLISLTHTVVYLQHALSLGQKQNYNICMIEKCIYHKLIPN